MTLYDMSNAGIVLQGNIRLSVWLDGAEIHALTFEYEDDFFQTYDFANIQAENGGVPFDEMEILYMFSSCDGYLHIELDGDSA